MKILVSIEHPAWAYQYKFIIKELQKRGHRVEVLAINKDMDLELLENFGISFNKIANTTGKNRCEKACLLLLTTWRAFLFCLKYKPDLFLGNASPLMAINAFIFHKKYLVFEDTENNIESLFLCKLFATNIITPTSFKSNLGPKQIRVKTYKEIAYLHPKYFTPNPSILADLNLKEGQIFTIARFVSWDASHDMGYKGFNNEEKVNLVNVLKKYGPVFISSEASLPEELKQYEYDLSRTKMHDLLYYATLLFTEGRTMASEAAILGTHSVYYNVATEGYTTEQEEKYQLVSNFKLGQTEPKEAINKCKELIETKDLWKIGKEKRKKLLDEQIDLNEYILNLVDKMLGHA